jgi:hypothetical protein
MVADDREPKRRPRKVVGLHLVRLVALLALATLTLALGRASAEPALGYGHPAPIARSAIQAAKDPRIHRALSVQSGADPVIAAAGDIACDPQFQYFNNGSGSSTYCHEQYTSNLFSSQSFAAILPLGDIQYWCDGQAAFDASYHPTWGRFKAVTHPATGNHEYYTSGGTGCDTTGHGAGYFNYFGASAGDPTKAYYSYDIGTWHLIALNTNCASVGGCGAGSPQEQWLRADLSAHANACTLAYFHYPLFSSKTPLSASSTFWKDLYAAGADIVLSAHVHNYERFAPQTPAGVYDPKYGISEFVVGTGGMSLEGFPSTIAPNSQVRSRSFGILTLTLHPSGYDFQFLPDGRNGNTFTDSGTGSCHGAPGAADTTPPTVSVAAPVAGASVGGTVSLSATASDDTGVDHVDFLVNGAVVGTDSSAPYAVAWNSKLVADGAAAISARAVDAAGNAATSSSVSVTVDNTPPETTITSPVPGSGAAVSFSFTASEAAASFACSLDNAAFAACSSPASYSGLASGSHTFQVRATDLAGNTDPTPAAQTWTTSSGAFLFGADFESGSFSQPWTVKTGADGTAAVQTVTVHGGTYAASFTETTTSGSYAYARAPLPSTQTTLTVTGWFDVLQEGASGGNVPLLRLFDPNGTRILSLYRQNQSSDLVRINDAATATSTSGRLPLGTWAQFSLKVTVAGTSSTILLQLNGTTIFQSAVANLGTTGIAALQIGNETARQSGAVAVDDIAVSS